MWASDDFLATSTRIDESRSISAVMSMGAGAGGTRNIAGNSPIHMDFEDKANYSHITTLEATHQ